ncbi:hypothetical protein K0B04_02470 [Patescibacteria group bacterium]|nr:hypothetical protein [Patescibacteria group bacterium]
MNNKKHKINKKFQKGMGLVEVIVALGITVLSITALVSLSISTLRTSLNSKLLLEGSKIANREIELVRAYRDGGETLDGQYIPRSWSSFVNSVRDCTLETPCYIGSSGPLLGVGSQNLGTAEEVTWYFIVTDPDTSAPIIENYFPTVVRISVSVNWAVGNQDKAAYIYTDLSNWRAR